MKNSPLVSIVVNCYNGEAHLRKALNSVYAQTYQNWEIIFWDNKSTDHSADIAHEYDSRLKYYCGQETIPLGAARNVALKKVQGEFVAFLDCDDVWLPGKLQKQVDTMKRANFALCYGGVYEIDEKGEKIGTQCPTNKEGLIFNQLLKQFDINLPTTMIRISALKENELEFDTSVTASEEYCLFMQLAVNCEFYSTSDVLALYRIHNGALTNRSISKWAAEREYTLDLICHNHSGIREKYPSAFSEAYARARYYRARHLAFRGEKMKAVRELSKNFFVNYRYSLLLFLLFFSSTLWNFVHTAKSNRVRFS